MKLPLVLLASAAALAAVPAQAADEGFYVGAGVGQMNTQVDDIWGSGYDFDEDDFGFKIFGGYQFFSWLGVEAAYVDGGQPDVKQSEMPVPAAAVKDRAQEPMALRAVAPQGGWL